jgi:hypothetical protein
MLNPIITPPRVPLVDPNTGLISRAWYLFFLSLNNVANAVVDDPIVSPSAESLIASYDALLQTLTQEVQTQPTQESALDQIAELQKQIEGLQATPVPQLGTVTDVTGTAPVVSSGGTAPNISLAAGYGDTQNPYGAKTANFVLAGPTTGVAAAPAFRALVAADIPVLPYGTGDVVGPASATDNAIARYNLTTGKLIQNSLVIVDDTGSVTGVNSLTAESLTVNNNATLGFSNTDTLDVRARIISDLEPNTNNAKDIGTSGRNWRDGFFGRNLDTVNLSVTGTTSFDGAQGTSGQVLTSAGTGNTPTWTTPTTGTITAVSVVSANGFAGTSSGGATPALTLSTTVTGLLKGNGTAISAAVAGTDYLVPSAPVTKTANFTVADGETWLINNKSGSSCTVTLPTPSTNTGRVLNFQNYQNQTLVSASSNVVPLAGGSAGTAILQAVAGANATLVSDGTSWIMTKYDSNNSLELE